VNSARVFPTRLFAARLNGLAEQAINRIDAYVQRRPAAMVESRARIEYDQFAKSYSKAKVAGFAGDLAGWVEFCRQVLEAAKEQGRVRGHPVKRI